MSELIIEPIANDHAQQNGPSESLAPNSQETPECPNPRLVLGDDIPTEDRQAAVRHYLERGFTVIPVRGPNEGPPAGRGKAPKVCGFQTWTPADLDEATIQEFWGEGRDSNLALLLKGAHIVIDLDSKADHGNTAEQWLSARTDLQHLPRERTPGGLHLHCLCPDLPAFTSRSGSPFNGKPVRELAPGFMAELLFAAARHTVVVSPSVHPTGDQYRWVCGGDLPVVLWADLQSIFNFEVPDSASDREGPEIDTTWLREYSGDLKTLDIVALAQEAGIYGRVLDVDAGRHSVRCPFRDEHSNSDEPWTEADTSTVVFESQEGHWPVFHCSHAHCQNRGIPEFLAAVNAANPGIVDRHCSALFSLEPSAHSRDHRPRIILPGIGRPQGLFATEVAADLARSGCVFARNDHIVEVRRERAGDATGGIKLDVITPPAAVTLFEREIEFGRLMPNGENEAVFVPHSLSAPGILLSSPELRDRLPSIERVLEIPIPMLYDGRLGFPNLGYDPRFQTFTASGARMPSVLPSLDEAVDVINDIMDDFCWKNVQSHVHAIARLITPMCRGLMGWAKAPLFIYRGNRPRLGKDTAAQIPIIVFTGRASSYPPLDKGNDDEMRKRITSALRSGQQFFHIANLRGHINFASLENATDASRLLTDRLLGSNQELTLINEMEYSFSANVGTTWTPDIEGRSRIVDLFFAEEDLNARRFRHPDLHSYVHSNRHQVLDAILTLITHWDRQGRPDGPTPFASFPAWSQVVGGILTSAGIGDPCLPHGDQEGVAGDPDTEDMRRLFQLAVDSERQTLTKRELYALIESQEELLFGYLDLGARSGQTSLGRKLEAFDRRELSGITMRIDRSDRSRPRYVFSREMRTLRTLQTFSLGRGVSLSPVFIESRPEPAGVAVDRGEREEGGSTQEVRNVCNVRIGSQAVDTQSVPFRPLVYVTQDDGVDQFLQSLDATSGPVVALGIKTFGEGAQGALDPWTNTVRLVSLAFGRNIFVLDVRALEHRMLEVIAALSRKVIVVHKAHFDLLTLRLRYGLRPVDIICTLTMSRLLSAGQNELKHDLASVVERYLGLSLAKDQATSDWTVAELSQDQLEYSANDVRHLSRLALKLLETGQVEGLDQVMQLEMDLIPVLLDMEVLGFPADRGRLETIIAEMGATTREAEAVFRATLGGTEINLDSPDQVREAFRQIAIDLPDTRRETLSEVDHLAARELVRYKEVVKEVQQAQGYLEAIGNDGRIHCVWDSSSVQTGRISSKSPNLQNVSRGRLREVFRSAAGRKLVIADYSQIELRVAAVHANDATMLEIFQNGEDIHRRTAAGILCKSIEEVTTEERRKAKAVNFGFLYGQGADGFVRYAWNTFGIEISREEACRFRSGWLRLFPGISAWQDRCRQAAGGGESEVRTILGRRRHLLAASCDTWWNRYTTLLNTPIQGIAGDGLKRSMLRLSRELGTGAAMVGSVHDELIVECPEDRAQAVLEQVRTVMVEEMSAMLDERVPIEVEASICDSWADKG